MRKSALRYLEYFSEGVYVILTTHPCKQSEVIARYSPIKRFLGGAILIILLHKSVLSLCINACHSHVCICIYCARVVDE